MQMPLRDGEGTHWDLDRGFLDALDWLAGSRRMLMPVSVPWLPWLP